MIDISDLSRQLNSALRSNDHEKISYVFESIYHSYYRLIGYVISKYVKDTNIVNDLISDTFVKFYKAMFNTKIRNIKYYLVTIAKNLAITYLKDIKKVDIVYDDDIVFSVEDENDSKYSSLVEDLKKVLDEEEVKIILLHVLYDYSFKDISGKLGISLSTVKSKYYRGIEKVRKENER